MTKLNNNYALDKYDLSLVSTLIMSPILINKGTCTTSQVDNVAGFLPPVAVSHFSHGGVSITSSSQLGSNSILIGFPLYS
jgi:hypothetical protein